MRLNRHLLGQQINRHRRRVSPLILLSAIAIGLLSPAYALAGTIQITGLSAAGPLPVNSGSLLPQWEVSRDAGAKDWAGTVSNTITFQSGDERAKLLAFNAPTVVLSGADLNKYFDAAWSTSGPNSGSQQIIGVWTVDWTWTPTYPGNPAFDQSTISHSVTVSVVGYVPEPSSFALVALGGFGMIICTRRRLRA